MKTKIIYGFFNGKNFAGENGIDYPVPSNFISKSKLIEGDAMTIEVENGLKYKVIKYAVREFKTGEVIKFGGRTYIEAEGQLYEPCFSAISYYGAEEGDEVMIIIPPKGSQYCAIEALLAKNKPKENQFDDEQLEELEELKANQ
jgi:hypothetical protein